MKKPSSFALILTIMSVLQGCVGVACILEHGIERATSRSSVGDDRRKNILIGAEYELINDLYIYKYRFSNEFHFDRDFEYKNYYQSEDIPEEWLKKNPYRRIKLDDPESYIVMFQLIPSGTKIIISDITYRTVFGIDDNCGREIFGTFNDPDGRTITAKLNALFIDENSQEHNDTLWNFTADERFLKKIDKPSFYIPSRLQ